jgi:hypothetical protein
MNHNERIELIQGLHDRLLYLTEEQRREFLEYLDALYNIYPIPRVVRYGKDIVHPESESHGA